MGTNPSLRCSVVFVRDRQARQDVSQSHAHPQTLVEGSQGAVFEVGLQADHPRVEAEQTEEEDLGEVVALCHLLSLFDDQYDVLAPEE